LHVLFPLYLVIYKCCAEKNLYQWWVQILVVHKNHFLSGS
jgi:hypothetical protein